MTNQEAKKNIVAYMYYAIDDLPEDVGKALDIAIKALEQEPSGDLISLEVVIEWLKAKDIIKLSSQEETARRELKALPWQGES